MGDGPFAFACVWGTGQMWPLNELWRLTLEASYIRFEPRWRSETKHTTVTQPEEVHYSTVDEASLLAPLKYTFMIHNASNCAHRSHLHPFFVLSLSCFWSFLLVGGWKTHKTTFCHAMTKNTRCKLYIFISVRDDMVFVNILFIVGFTAKRIHCKNRCKLIRPITSLLKTQLDFHLKVYRYFWQKTLNRNECWGKREWSESTLEDIYESRMSAFYENNCIWKSNLLQGPTMRRTKELLAASDSVSFEKRRVEPIRL